MLRKHFLTTAKGGEEKKKKRQFGAMMPKITTAYNYGQQQPFAKVQVAKRKHFCFLGK